MDTLLRALSERSDLRVAVVDVSRTAGDLAARHLSGPVAGRALGHALAAVALLSVHLKDDSHAILLQLNGDGPLGGLSAEVWGLNRLRGYTHNKVLPGLDGLADVDIPAVFGRTGTLSVIQSTPREILYQSVVRPSPPTVRAGLARYYNDSLQRPAGVELWSSGQEDVEQVRGLLVEKLPGGDTEAFVRALEALQSGALRDALATGGELDAVGAALGLSDLRALDSSPLQFGCRCSAAKVLGVLAALPPEDLREIAAGEEAQEVICHFCGENYRVAPQEVARLLGSSDM